MSGYDTIVIGGGANGLAAAALLGRAGQRVLVLERGATVGGTNATEEFHPGFKVNVCRDDPGWIPPGLVRDLDLEKHGLRVKTSDAGITALTPGDAALALSSSLPVAVQSLKRRHVGDAGNWAGFCTLIADAGRFLAATYAIRPPRVQSRAPADLFALMALGRRLRRLGRRQMMEVVRLVPMPIADLLEEWFSDEILKGALATLGVRDVVHGPMAGGTALVFLHSHVGLAGGEVGARRVVEGGVAGLPTALERASRAAGVEVKTDSEVASIVVRDGRVTGVALVNGDELNTRRVVSSTDPKRTFALVDASWLDPELLRAVDNVRMRGATARVHFAVDGLPAFDQLRDADDGLGGLLVLSSGVSALERAADQAKYGQLPNEPALTAVIPSLNDPSLAPSGRHVISVDVHHAPYALHNRWGDGERRALGDLVELQLSRCAPDFTERKLERWVLTPADLESRFGATGGSLTHGDLALDQFLFMRPVPSCARYATPLRGLWLCGTGTHPANAAGAGGMLAAREILERASGAADR